MKNFELIRSSTILLGTEGPETPHPSALMGQLKTDVDDTTETTELAGRLTMNTLKLGGR
jgi:hypothetical protein